MINKRFIIVMKQDAEDKFKTTNWPDYIKAYNEPPKK